MVTGDLDNQMKEIYRKIDTLNTELDNIKLCSANLRTPISVLEQLIDLQEKRTTSVNKTRKDIDRQLQQIYDNYKYAEQDKLTYQKIAKKENEIREHQTQVDNLNKYIHSGVETVLNFLKKEQFVEGPPDDLNLTFKGKVASHLREIHCLVFAQLVDDKKLDHLTSRQLVSLFSIFTNISVSEDFTDFSPNANDDEIQINVNLLTLLYNKYRDEEIKNNINTGIDYSIHYDLLNYLDDWCCAQTVEECKLVLQKIGEEKQIFLGEFVKALLKINNISAEMEKIAELTGNIAFLSKLKEIPNMTLKYVVTNQSLYV
jgi:antiviral helicase SKI2